MFQDEVSVQDATEVREFARTALDSIGDAVIGTNLAGNVTYLNRVAESIVGWSREAALGRPLDEVFRLLDGTHRAASLDSVALAIQQNKAVSPAVDCVLIRRDGLESAIEQSVVPLHDRYGHVAGAVMVFHYANRGHATSPERSRLPDQPLENERQATRFFERDMSIHAFARQSLEEAVKRREFVLHYQPILDLQTGAMTGAEALIRWRHPQRGLVHPTQFMPRAEEYGLIVPIGRWVLREVCRQARAWRDAQLPPMPVAINISAVELRSEDFVADLRANLHENGLEPCDLQIDLTETTLLQNSMTIAAVLRTLAGMGMGLALDNFGTGYASLSILQHFPIEALKIDGSFVRGITTDAGDAATVGAVIGIARSLRRRVIAEGVETREQLAFLQTCSCTEGQGYYFSRPIVAEELAVLLRAA